MNQFRRTYQFRRTSKLGIALAITAISVVAMADTQASSYFIQTADAQPRLPNNSVRTDTIVDGQVMSADIGNGEVTTDDLADGTIQKEDIADGVIPSSGTGQLVVTERSSVSKGVAPNTNVLIGVNCNSDEIPTGGGFDGFGFGDEVWVQSSQKGGSENNGWQVTLTYVSGPAPRDVTVYAECAEIVP